MERINLETPRAAGLPVVKRTALGQQFNGAVLKAEPRDRLKRGDDGTMQPIINPRTGRNSQELVVTCLALPGTTSPAGLGEEESVPDPGSIVRLILKGKAFGDWIEAKRSLPNGAVAVGDVVTQTTTVAQVYDAQGNPSGGEISDQAKVDEARSRGRSIGIYGPLTLSAPKAGSEWTDKAVAAYEDLRKPIPAEEGWINQDDYGNATVSAPAAKAESKQPSSFLPDRPAFIPEEAWKTMPESLKRSVAESMGSVSDDQPPF